MTMIRHLHLAASLRRRCTTVIRSSLLLALAAHGLPALATQPQGDQSADESESVALVQPDLQALLAEARQAVEESLKLKLPSDLEVRYASRNEVGKALAAEQLTKHALSRMVAGSSTDPDEDLPLSSTLPLAHALIAKHFPAQNLVLVVWQNLLATLESGAVEKAHAARRTRA